MSLFVNFRNFVKRQIKGVSIRRKSLPNGTSGQIYRQGNKWIIEIEKRNSQEMQCEILLHELAHCVSRSHWHGKKWALGHETTYRLWMQFIDTMD